MMTPPAQPEWLRSFANAYVQQNQIGFVLTGNLTDPVRTPQLPDGKPLTAFLKEELFRPRDYILQLTPGEPPQLNTPAAEAAFKTAVEDFDQRNHTGHAKRFPTAADRAMMLVEAFASRVLRDGKGLGIIITQADQLKVTTDPDHHLLLQQVLKKLATAPVYTKSDFTLLLLTETPSALPELPDYMTLTLPLPSAAERRAALSATADPNQLDAIVDATEQMRLQQITTMRSTLEREQITLSSATVKRYIQQHLHSEERIRLPNGQLPDWLRQFRRLHRTRTITQFILHGNTVDYVRVEDHGSSQYLKLNAFITDELFKDYDQVISFDRATGLHFRNADDENDFFITYYFEEVFKKNTQAYEAWLKKLKATEYTFSVIERYMTDRLAAGKRVALIFDFAETLVPMAGGGGALGMQDRAILVFFMKWAKASQFAGGRMTTLLLTDNLAQINQQLVRNPYTAELQIDYPDAPARRAYIGHIVAEHPDLPEQLEMSLEVLARDTAGLTLTQLDTLLAEIRENLGVFTYTALNERKKDIIESEAGGMLGFVETTFDLDSVAGHAHAKTNLRAAADALRKNRGDVLPMGYLVNGPVGTGKTFMVSCFANEIGVPMVELKNFRSQYVGQSEANLEKVLRLLTAMSPVGVMIDEADAMLGNRSQGGDSGVSSRIFSKIASFMSNTAHRGKIIWFLLTARPDLMPVDLKRQGRAEEHIALFYPETVAEKRELFAVMLKKTGITSIDAEAFANDFYEGLRINSGADMEAALTRAKFRAVASDTDMPTKRDIIAAFEDFIPPTYPEEIELMNYAAVLECTSKQLLPEAFREMSREQVVARFNELQAQVGS